MADEKTATGLPPTSGSVTSGPEHKSTSGTDGGGVKATVHPYSGVDVHEAGGGRVYRRGETTEVTQSQYDEDSQHRVTVGDLSYQVVVQEGTSPKPKTV